MSISVLINTKNSARTLERTLKSVKFADQLVIVDMKSSDQTVKIAQEYTTDVFHHQDVGYVEPARNFALSKADSDWLLIVDADEEVPATLRKALQEIVKLDKAGQLDADCFYLPRKNIVFDKWIQKTGWWPDYQLRFFRRGHVEWSNQIHSVPITKGTVREIPAKEKLALVHHNYQTIDQFIERLNRYTLIQSRDRDGGEISSAEVIDKFSSELMRRLFVYHGVEEGLHGVSLSFLQAMYEAVVVMKAWQSQGFPAGDASSQLTIKAMRRFQRELAFWTADWGWRHTRGLRRVYWRLRRKLMR